MKKRIISLLLTFILIISSIPFAVIPVSAAIYTGACGENLTWTLDTEAGTLTISGSGEMYDWSHDAGAPWYDKSQYITNVDIGNGVTKIGAFAFTTCSFTNIVIPNSVTSMGDQCFSHCYSLVSITIPASVTSIGDQVFGSCFSLEKIIVDENNPMYASLDGVLFDKDITTLIRHPAMKPETSYIIPDGVKSIGKTAFSCCTALSSITIPDSVTSIGEEAFHLCLSLTSITLPDGVSNIGNYAFLLCISITNITIPDSVISIGEQPFRACTSLEKIIVDENNPNYKSESGVLFSKDTKALIAYPANKSDTNYIIPDGVVSIENGAFQYASALTNITISYSVTSIGTEAFANCDSIESITIPDGVTRIEEKTFFGCTSLKSVTIPGSVTSIGPQAFYICSAFGTVYYLGTMDQWENISIDEFNESLINSDKVFYHASIVYGDVNGDGRVTITDVLKMRKYIAGIDTDESGGDYAAADVNGDTRVTITDVLLVRKYIAGIITEFPAE